MNTIGPNNKINVLKMYVKKIKLFQYLYKLSKYIHALKINVVPILGF